MKHTSSTSTSHNQSLILELRADPDFGVEYVRAALEDSDEPRVLLIALRPLAEARGGLAQLANDSGATRESLYRALSPKGNPRLSTLLVVARALGLRLTVESA